MSFNNDPRITQAFLLERFRYDPESGLLTRDSFWHDLKIAMTEAADRSMPLSVARFSFDSSLDGRITVGSSGLSTAE